MATRRKKECIERLAEALILNPVGERHLAMFSAYLDESGQGVERQSFLAVGGLVSSALQWGRLQKDWTKHLLTVPNIPLDESGRPLPFHMTDFETGNWPVSGYRWPNEKRKVKFLDGLIQIICERVKLRVYTIVYLGHYHILFPKDRRKKIPWVLSALGCASRISKWAEQRPCDPVPFIFERGGEGWGIAYDSYCRMERLGHLGKTKIGSWTMEDKYTTGLQAADLWSWELRKHFTSQMGEYPGLRPSLEKLIYGVSDGAGFILDGHALQSMIDDFKQGTSTVEICKFCPNSLPKLNREALSPDTSRRV
jgi:hypothetical protein